MAVHPCPVPVGPKNSQRLACKNNNGARDNAPPPPSLLSSLSASGLAWFRIRTVMEGRSLM